MALQGNLLGPVIFLILWNIINFGFRYYSQMYGYETGIRILKNMKESNIVQKISEGASVLGLMVLGVLVASWINVKTPLMFGAAESQMALQDILDSIVPSLLPLVTTLTIVKLLRKKITPNKLIVGIFAVALVLSLTGILAV